MNVKYKVNTPDYLTSEQHQVYINKMTNWQRNQWARAGSPKAKNELKYYTILTRRSMDEEKTEEG